MKKIYKIPYDDEFFLHLQMYEENLQNSILKKRFFIIFVKMDDYDPDSSFNRSVKRI